MRAAVWKRRAVAGLIALLIAWPAAQHVLALRSNANPWYLFGFAMYCVPHQVIDFRYGKLVEGQLEAIDAGRITPTLRRALEDYGRIYGFIGTLGSRADLIEQLFAAAPEAEQIVLIFTHLQLDLSSGNLAERRVSYGFERNEPRRLQRLQLDLPPLFTAGS